MSYLLETLGRGLLSQLHDAFRSQLPAEDELDLPELITRCADSPRSADLALRLGMVHLRAMRLSDARACFERARGIDPQAPYPTLGLACVFDELGRDDLAVGELLHARELDPQDPAITFAIAMCRERSGDEAAAISEYARAIGLCPRLRNAYERRAALAIHRSQWDDALRSYEHLNGLDPGDVDVLLTLATLHLAARQPASAIERFQCALLIEPDCTEEATRETQQLCQNGRTDEALAAFESLVEKHPGVSEFRVHLGDLYARSGDDAAAIASYRAAIELHPGFIEATVKLGTQHLRQGRYEDAAQAFNRAVELNDRMLLAFAGLCVAQAAAGQHSAALETLGLAASLEPNSTLLLSETARLHLRATQMRDAAAIPRDRASPPHDARVEDWMNEALRRHAQALLRWPRRADLLYRHGVLLRHQGAFDRAQRAFCDALQVQPTFVKAAVRLGVCLRERGRVDEALDTLRHALFVSPETLQTHYRLALRFAQRAQFDVALDHFEQDLPADIARDFRANLTLALQSVGMVDRAAATWRCFCEVNEAQLAETRGVRTAPTPHAGDAGF